MTFTQVCVSSLSEVTSTKFSSVFVCLSVYSAEIRQNYRKNHHKTSWKDVKLVRERNQLTSGAGGGSRDFNIARSGVFQPFH